VAGRAPAREQRAADEGELDLLDAIKAELSRDLSPGRYVLAESTRYSTLPQAGDSVVDDFDRR
jgi:hypothetical protein